MKIGELSRRTGAGRHLLRYYEEQGLLAPERSDNGYRSYPDEATVTVMQIRQLLKAGLSTAEIAYLQPCLSGSVPELEPCVPLLDTLYRRLGELDQRIASLQASRSALHGYIQVTELAAQQIDESDCVKA